MHVALMYSFFNCVIMQLPTYRFSFFLWMNLKKWNAVLDFISNLRSFQSSVKLIFKV